MISKYVVKAKRAALVASGVAASLFTGAVPAHAQISGGIEAANTGTETASVEDVVERIITILLFVIGAASVIMLIIGGIRYVVSAGDQNAVTGAKNTILYALVGVGVAIVAYAAVQFVFNTLTGTTADTSIIE